MATGADRDQTELHRDRARASSFGANAELYEATRPRYPEALIDDLLATGPSAVLDVGCGTGILGRAFLARGCDVLGVEPDDKMADVARAHGLAVELGTFESWDPGGRTFALLVSGQAWHWVEPAAGARKAAEVVERGGVVAHAWNVGTIEGALHGELDEVYERLGKGRAVPIVPHRRRDGHQHDSELAFVATGEFEEPEHTEYAFSQRYTSAEWVAQLETHSDHHLLEPEDRTALLDAVANVIDAHGGSFEMSYVCEVTRFRRR